MKTTINVFSPNFKRQAHSYYAQMRKNRPVYPFRLPGGQQAWLVTSYRYAAEVTKDPRFIKDPRVFPEKNTFRYYHDNYREFIMSHILNLDPPDRTRIRKLVQPSFTPQAIAKLRQTVETLAGQLLDEIQSRGTREFSLIKDFAFPLPFLVIAEMLGVPSADREKFREWSNIIIEAMNDPKSIQAAHPYYQAFFDYVKDLVAARKKNLQDDLISAWIQAEEEGDKLSETELYGMVFLLILAGHETTVNLIGNGILAFMENRGEWEKLKENSDLIPSAVEEVLRYYSPVEVATTRWAKEDLVLGDEQIHQGDTVFLVLGSINRDEELVENGDLFDITRTPIKHMAFGHGIHFCLGAPLARLEGEIAFRALVNRMPNLELAIPMDEIEFRSGILLRGLQELPVKY